MSDFEVEGCFSDTERFEKALEEAITKVLETFDGVDTLSAEQTDGICNFIRRKDVLAVLPTGFGKSLLFQLVPGICKELHNMGYSHYPKKPIVIVVCPLNALIECHMKELKQRGISCTCISGDDADKDGALGGKYSFVFANPEALILNEKWRKMLQTPVYQENLFGIVADEAHVIPKWGYDSKEKQQAFRACFGRLGELRSLAPVQTPFMALTATATRKTRQDIIEGLNLKENLHLIVASPNRPNIYLYVAKVNKNLSETFGWLIERLVAEKQSCPRTLVYCKTTRECGQLFSFFKNELKEHAYVSNELKSENMLIGMFHHNTLEKHKGRVTTSLYTPSGTCRVVFATNALGMGINFKDIHYVIHYGPPRCIEDFVQEIGRAGRDGRKAVSALFFQGKHLSKCDKSIKKYAKDSSCLRNLLMAEFEETKTTGDHNCCLSCHLNCKCGEEKCNIDIPFMHHTAQARALSKANVQKRKTTLQQRMLLEELLRDKQQELSSKCTVYYMSPECTTGFSNNLIKVVLSHCKYIFDLDYIMENLPVFKKEHAYDILHMVRDTFEDFDFNVEFSIGSEELFPQESYDLEYGGNYSNSEESESDYFSDSEL